MYDKYLKSESLYVSLSEVPDRAPAIARVFAIDRIYHRQGQPMGNPDAVHFQYAMGILWPVIDKPVFVINYRHVRV